MLPWNRLSHRLWHVRGIRCYERDMCRYVQQLRIMRRPDGAAIWQSRPVMRDQRPDEDEPERTRIGPWEERIHLRERFRPDEVPFASREDAWLPRPRGERPQESRYWKIRARLWQSKRYRSDKGFLMTIKHPYWAGVRSSEPIPFPKKGY